MLSPETEAAARRQVKGRSIAWAGGKVFDFDDLANIPITLREYCFALAFTPRFRGQTFYRGDHCFFGVLQHCFIGALDLHRQGHSPEIVISFLTHESDEVIPGDMPGPLKQIFPGFRETSKTIGGAIDGHFGWTHPDPDLIKRQDIRMLVTEKRDLMPGHGNSDFSTDGSHMSTDYDPLPAPIVPLDHPREAVPLWLDLYHGMRAQL